MNFLIERAPGPSTVNENRPTLRPITMMAQNTGGKMEILYLPEEGERSQTGSGVIDLSSTPESQVTMERLCSTLSKKMTSNPDFFLPGKL